ncbi:VRR-NUC domain-containing protein [Vibrio quintilis]|uniref:Uncharacterized protein n=1 Tax=Vibrio quintilis TaxID=1117707 RepID=A0A1M7YRI0_9VIBR|nr:VRR-NUC domain-containing protein [Vibrio quintilis]SHO55213.1 hypothetical protein VQ7734_00932 [Vibrio quintilis]
MSGSSSCSVCASGLNGKLDELRALGERGELDEKQLICTFVCMCDVNALKTKAGRSLKQVCVDKGLDWTKKAGIGNNILPEVGYYMLKKPPMPLMVQDNGVDTSQPIRNFWHRMNRVRKILDGKKYKKYTLRIPDVVVTNQPGQIPTQDNIKKVYEIKFPPDDWGANQERDYRRIAGQKKKLVKLTPDSCDCQDKDKQPQTYPALEKAWKEDHQQQLNKAGNVLKDGAIVVGGAILTAALVLDDVVGGEADDVAIPGVVAAVSRAASRLLSVFSKPVAAAPVIAFP